MVRMQVDLLQGTLHLLVLKSLALGPLHALGVSNRIGDLAQAQRALLGPGEVAARAPGAHAEVTVLTQAQQSGLTPPGVSIPFVSLL